MTFIWSLNQFPHLQTMTQNVLEKKIKMYSLSLYPSHLQKEQGHILNNDEKDNLKDNILKNNSLYYYWFYLVTFALCI